MAETGSNFEIADGLDTQLIWCKFARWEGEIALAMYSKHSLLDRIRKKGLSNGPCLEYIARAISPSQRRKIVDNFDAPTLVLIKNRSKNIPHKVKNSAVVPCLRRGRPGLLHLHALLSFRGEKMMRLSLL